MKRHLLFRAIPAISLMIVSASATGMQTGAMGYSSDGSVTLHYADGPGTKLYNGSVSAMSWTMGADATQIDNLHIYYTGNRVTGVLEDAEPVTTNGSMDFAGTTGREMAVEYNGWGAMTKDEARGITSITYDRLGNPSHVSFSSPRGSYASFVYSATGERLKATHYTSPIFHGGVAEANYLTDPESTGDNAENADNDDNQDITAPAAIDSGISDIAGMTKLEYHGPVIYRNGKVDMVRFPGGYATINGSAVTFHYYTQDYLGNNRAVVNGSTGAIEQTVAYYPYGGMIANLGIYASKQPFKFGGKELTQQNGLNEYDFGARQYYPAVPHFTTVDPLCEKYYWLSPYLYCGNNPVNAVDPSGKDIWRLDSEGHISSSQSFEEFDMIMVVDKNNKINSSWKGDYGSVSSQFSKGNPSEGAEFTGFEIDGDGAGTQIFEFLAQNTSVEWSQLKTGSDSEAANYLSTNHLPNKDGSSIFIINEKLNGVSIREDIHSHPSNNKWPSGIEKGSGDIAYARWLDSLNPIKATYKIYVPGSKEYIEYNAKSNVYDF